MNGLPIGLDKAQRKDLFDLLATDKERSGRWRREKHRLVLEGDVPVVLPTDEIVKRIEDVAPRPRCVRELLVSGSYPMG